ncbi:hypothetical protein EAG18_05525 [Pseudoalteromonas sp. J010]|uniref:phage tail protein n=1 Tax=Pseudoalteromonas sp. J010 TaxID=998465 RepID=UPI000F64CDCF|nr:tail fiber protein [Pseudoalteromonas sp. J010]RRS09601.1 hypothetical protein EAG18_05525 [Pseudoalteromonas sp. J010]
MSAAPLLGDIEMAGYNFVPRGYYSCHGVIADIGENPALYSLLGISYGGNGRTTYQLPDFRGVVPMGTGQLRNTGANRQVGWALGYEEVSLSVLHLPSHTHTATAEAQTTVGQVTGNFTARAKNGLGNTDNPNGAYWATGETVSGRETFSVKKAYSTTADTTMAAGAIQMSGNINADATTSVKVTNLPTGGGLPVPILQPSLVTNFIISADGTYPSRS